MGMGRIFHLEQLTRVKIISVITRLVCQVPFGSSAYSLQFFGSIHCLLCRLAATTAPISSTYRISPRFGRFSRSGSGNLLRIVCDPFEEGSSRRISHRYAIVLWIRGSVECPLLLADGCGAALEWNGGNGASNYQQAGNSPPT